jgi:hypothetical protein
MVTKLLKRLGVSIELFHLPQILYDSLLELVRVAVSQMLTDFGSDASH